MKGFVTGAAITALMVGASTADAQRILAAKDVPPGHRPPPGMCRVWIDGVPPGRQPAVTDCTTAQLRAPLNSRIIYGDLTPFPGRGRNRVASDCRYEQSRTTLGDIVFGRRSRDYDLNCRYDSRRNVNAWYELGRDANGRTIYQRRSRLRDGTVIVQRAWRARDGSMVVFDTRYPRAGLGLSGLGDDDLWLRSDRSRIVRTSGSQLRLASDDDGRKSKNAKVKSGKSKGKGKGRN